MNRAHVYMDSAATLDAHSGQCWRIIGQKSGVKRLRVTICARSAREHRNSFLLLSIGQFMN